MAEKPVLEMRNIVKTFPGVKALNNANLTLYAGEVHSLLGENGAGKSTLMKILAGIHKPNSGEIYIDGEPVEINNINMSQKLGISIIHQELCLASNMTIAENIFLGREPHHKFSGFVDYNEINNNATSLLETYGLNIDSKTIVGKLSVAQQQIVEIAKALSMNPRVIVMDEPTASLTNKEVIKLFDAIEKLKEKGVAIVYISHRMEEIFALSNRVTVMRDGSYIGTKQINKTDSRELIKMMVGRELTELYSKPEIEPGKKVFEVKNLCIGKKINDINFFVREGEILGFYGLVGSGRTEIMRAIFGIDRFQTGELYLDGREVKIKSTAQAIKHGLALVPEDRKEQGGVMIQSVAYNLTLGVLDKIFKGIKVNKKIQVSLIKEFVQKLSIKISSPEQVIGKLSGGNQQKVIIAKWLATNPKLLILDEPTRGIDVGAKKEIYELISKLVTQGMGVIVVSSELPEIINMSSRVIAMHEGKISAELIGDDINQENIIVHATGGNNDDSKNARDAHKFRSSEPSKREKVNSFHYQ
ncbi:sugar ABC transporter ATP-binding protein [Priestia megaterium]|uniref:sugar ABC transporter ATP-binding protein n=1 Tax=Priestia megaterium TaxID=1404 RepID=UPI003A7FD8D9